MTYWSSDTAPPVGREPAPGSAEMPSAGLVLVEHTVEMPPTVIKRTALSATENSGGFGGDLVGRESSG